MLTSVGHNRPLTLPEPEPTLPFDLPLSEPTYQHLPYPFVFQKANFLHMLSNIVYYQIKVPKNL